MVSTLIPPSKLLAFKFRAAEGQLRGIVGIRAKCIKVSAFSDLDIVFPFAMPIMIFIHEVNDCGILMYISIPKLDSRCGSCLVNLLQLSNSI